MRKLSLIGLLLAFPARSEAQLILAPQPFISSSGTAVGPILLTDGTANAPSLTFASGTTDGIYKIGAGAIGLSTGGFVRNRFDGSHTFVPGLGLDVTNQDVFLERDAANTLAQRNGTNAQTARWYRTYTDASNYERMFVTGNGFGSAPGLGFEVAGTGAARDFTVLNTTNAKVYFGTNNTLRWQVDTSGNFTGITATGGLGYGTGAGGAVTQLTSRATTVILNSVTGDITLFAAAGSATAASFTVTNSNVAVSDNIIINQKSGTNLYNTIVTTVGAGSFVVTFYTTGGTASDSPVFHFSVIKGVIS